MDDKTRKFRNKIYELVGDEYSVLGKYINCDTPINIKHNICGYEWNTTTPYCFTRKEKPVRCPQCNKRDYGKRALLTHDKFLNRITEENSDRFTIIGTYSKGENPIKIRCKTCGNIFDVKANKLTAKKGQRIICNVCDKPFKHSNRNTDWFKLKVEELVGDEYEVLGEYVHSEQPITLKHNKCGNVWNTTSPISFCRGTRCPLCNISKGESKISKLLNLWNIDYDSQKQYDNLLGINGGMLSYDFYLPKYNLLIEYQGEFHDGNAQHQTETKLKKQQEHDKRKLEYAKNNKIKLLEIWYWDYNNIEKILKEELKERCLNV